MSSSNIHPIFNSLVQRQEREHENGHRGCVIWLTGLSGSGKSSIAAQVERTLFAQKWSARVLDGDNLRSGLNDGLGFTLEDRRENIRRVAEVAKLFMYTGFVTICSFVSPTAEIRAYAKQIIGDDDFFEVFVRADLVTCESRDVKGLYAKARAGTIKGFTGIDSPYDRPQHPDLILATDLQTVTESSQELVNFIISRATKTHSPS